MVEFLGSMKKITYIIFIPLFMVSCATHKKNHRVEELDFVQKPSDLSVSDVVGYGLSAPLAGAGYAIDGAIYVVGGAGIFTVLCGPLLLLIAHSSANYVDADPCFHYSDEAFAGLHRHHPRLGSRIWRNTQDWRHAY